MAKGRKRKDSAGENVETYRHEDQTRKNAGPAGLTSYKTSKPKPLAIERVKSQAVSLKEKSDTEHRYQ